MDQQLTSNKLSVIIPICERSDNAITVYQEYRQYIAQQFENVEFICVVSNGLKQTADLFQAQKAKEPDLKLIVLNRAYGEATALQAGVDHATGSLLLFLPAYFQVKTEEITKLFSHIDEHDLVLARRWPREDVATNQLQTKIFNRCVKLLSNQNFSDIACGVKLVRADVFKELHIYGDQHRFLPLLAYQLGFNWVEVDLSQSEKDVGNRVYHPGVYVRRLLDLLAIVFLTKFNKKPLRFFGLLGTTSMAIGVFGLLMLAYERLVFDVAASDRPLLVVCSLLVVLGIQLLGIGLVGETITFTHASENREYRVKKIHAHVQTNKAV